MKPGSINLGGRKGKKILQKAERESQGNRSLSIHIESDGEGIVELAEGRFYLKAYSLAAKTSREGVKSIQDRGNIKQ